MKKQIVVSAFAFLAMTAAASAQSVWQGRSPTHYGAPGYDQYQAQQQQLQQSNQQLIYDQQRAQQLQQMQNDTYHSRRY